MFSFGLFLGFLLGIAATFGFLAAVNAVAEEELKKRLKLEDAFGKH